jgi:PPK2 family polyphosphate:nucleotide phosphotransferase
VAAFKVPTPIEAAHDFLWRIHQQTPAKGETVIFNRSHYEDVLVTRVHDFVPKDVWKERYETINEFEESLVESGTIVLKFFLYICKDEQKQRLLERQQDPRKAWKLSVGDWKERELWDDYIEAYEDAISKCSTKDAPWHIVPANEKWFRDLAVVEAIHDALKPYEDDWKAKLDKIGVKAKAEIDAYMKAR